MQPNQPCNQLNSYTAQPITCHAIKKPETAINNLFPVKQMQPLLPVK